MDIFTLFQFAIMIMLGIFFSAIAVNRQTPLTYALAGFIWLFDAVTNYVLSPTGTMTLGVTWLFGVLGGLFLALILHGIIVHMLDDRQNRYDVDGPL